VCIPITANSAISILRHAQLETWANASWQTVIESCETAQVILALGRKGSSFSLKAFTFKDSGDYAQAR